MFGSRRHSHHHHHHHLRPSNPPLTAATANPNATTAAAAVFRRHDSNASLSAAAAAAALRSRPMTPTRVADVQTKRSVRRSASVASAASASEPGQDPSALRRPGSSSSMAERTFRTPSPHRPASTASGRRRSQSLGRHDDDDAPPVPALPKHVDLQPHRRAQSLAVSSTPVRLASQKLASGDAPSWFGAAKLGDLEAIRRTDPAMASPPSSPLQPPPQDDAAEGARLGSEASSINFSYPTRTRVGSPAVAPAADPSVSPQRPVSRSRQSPSAADGRQATEATRALQQPGGQATTTAPARPPSASAASDQTLVYDPNSRRMVRQADLVALEPAATWTPQRLSGPRRRRRAAQRAGSRPAAGNVSQSKSGATRATPAAKTPVAAVSEPQLPLPKEEEEEEETPLAEPQMDHEEPVARAITSPPREHAKRPGQQHAHVVPDAVRPAVRKQPSVVHEEPELEDDESDNNRPHRPSPDALDAAPGRWRTNSEGEAETYSPASSPPHAAIPPGSFSVGPVTVLTDEGPKTLLGYVNASADGQLEPRPVGTESARQISPERTRRPGSPARQTHFGPVENLTVKHSPPPRSSSPRKSAMKRTSPPRAASPSGGMSDASGSASQEPAASRKKSVRVSFDDGATAVPGESAPASPSDPALETSPQSRSRHSWLANLGLARKDLPPLDDDEVMKPRPALPRFGSVRDRKPRDASPDRSERPLVRPRGEPKRSSPLLPSPPLLGPSGDHAVGAARPDHASGPRHAPNTSRLREPLPPAMTSAEGSGYLSDSSDVSSLISSEFEPQVAAPEPLPGAAARSEAALPKERINGSAAGMNGGTSPTQVSRELDSSLAPSVPSNPASRSAPGRGEKSLGQHFVDVPGGFPDEESDRSDASSAKRPARVTAGVKPAEPTPKQDDSAQLAAQPTTVDDTSDSESSIYSDAYEDLSEIDGVGFQSLNAVLESPMQPSTRSVAQSEHVRSEAPAQKAPGEAPKLETQMSAATTSVESPPAESSQDEWERAKAYFRSLPAEKRAQLVREAREEAGIEAGMEDLEPEKPRPSKKKSLERKNSERKALAVRMAEQNTTQQEKQKAVGPDDGNTIQSVARPPADDSGATRMRKTMRAEPRQPAVVAPAEGHRLRKSMRTNGSGVTSPESLTAEDPAAPKHPVAAAAPKAGGHRRSATSSQLEVAAATASSLEPAVRRRGSAGSESSFKRSRPSLRAESSGLRQSLRPTSSQSAQSDSRSSKRFSLRALSPTGSSSRRSMEASPGSASAEIRMRKTLRDSSTERKSPTGIRIPSLGLSYGGRKSGAKARGNKAPGSRFSSRFADSSDDDDGGGDGGGNHAASGFRSRFEDSSDDELAMPVPIPLSKSTPAPQTARLREKGSLASTALPEELEESEEAQAQDTKRPAKDQGGTDGAAAAGTATEGAAASLRRTRSGRGQPLPASQAAPAPAPAPALGTAALSATTASRSQPAPAGGSRPSRSRRGSSIFSVLRRRGSRLDGSGSGKIARAEISESAARRDTRLERSVEQLRGIRGRGRGRGGQEDEDEEEAGDGNTETEAEAEVEADAARSARLRKKQAPLKPQRAKRKQKQKEKGMGRDRGEKEKEKEKEGEAAAAGPFPSGASGKAESDRLPVLFPSKQGPEGQGEEPGAAFAAQFRRASMSENLGTRTLGGGCPPRFLHHRPAASLDLSPSPATANTKANANGEGSVAGSVAAASSTTTTTTTATATRKKRFAALRRMFGRGADVRAVAGDAEAEAVS